MKHPAPFTHTPVRRNDDDNKPDLTLIPRSEDLDMRNMADMTAQMNQKGKKVFGKEERGRWERLAYNKPGRITNPNNPNNTHTLSTHALSTHTKHTLSTH